MNVPATPKWTLATQRIDDYWTGIFGRSNLFGHAYRMVSVGLLGLLFLLVSFYFIHQSIRRALNGQGLFGMFGGATQENKNV